MYKCVSQRRISQTAFSILAAVSISISCTSFVVAKATKHSYANQSQQTDDALIAGFPFLKSKSDVSADSVADKSKDKSKNKDKKKDKHKDSDKAKATDQETVTDKHAASVKDAASDKDSSTDKSSNPQTATDNESMTDNGKASNKDAATDKNKTNNKVTVKDNQPAKAQEKADAKNQSAKKGATKGAAKQTAKLTKKEEKRKAKEAKKLKDNHADDQAKTAANAARKTKSTEVANRNAKAAEDANRTARAAELAGQKSKVNKVPGATIQGRPAYQADSALISLLNDLARALKDPSEQAKLGDENQKLVVQMALDVLTKALDSRNDANRIVQIKALSGKPMSAEAWSSGDIKVSDDCRGSLAAVWAKRENGLLNVTIAGNCRDKVAPSGKKVGEYVVVLSARSTVQKGFDIQSQADVNFWLAKLASVNVDADCCSTESASADKSAVSVESDTREIKKNSTVVLQSIVTERERSFGDSEASEKNSAAKQPAEEKQLTADRRRAEEARQAESEKQKAQNQIVEAEKQRKLEEERRRAEAAQKQKQDEDERLAQSEKQKKFEEKQKKVEEKQKKDDEKQRIAALEKQQKQEEKLAAEAEKKRRRDEEEKLAAAKEKAEADSILQAELIEKNREDALKNSKLSRKNVPNARQTRDDMILAEATRQAELERTGKYDIASGARTSREDLILEEATRQAEREQAEQNDIASGARGSRNDAILAEATREAEQERNEAAGMRVPYSTKSFLVDINDEPTPLRPTPSAAGATSHSSEIFHASPITNEVQPEAAPATQAIAVAPPIVPQSAVGRDSAGVPKLGKQPSAGSKLVIPERAIAGQYITASVVDLNHNGESGVELGFNGVSVTTDPHGQVTFMVPEDATPGNSLNVAVTGNPEWRASSIEVLQPLTTSSQQDSPSVDRTSQMVSTNGTVIIDGHNFDGVADHNKVLIDGTHECTVTAASPVQLRVTLPNNIPPGLHFATVNAGQNKSNPGRFELVTAQVQADPKEASKDQITKLIVKVLGTTNKVQVHLTNQSPEVIKISKGNDLRLTTSGGQNNSTIVPVQRLRKGSYRVGAVIE
jgi:hypothetical protein